MWGVRVSEHSGVPGKTPDGALRQEGAARRQAAREGRTSAEQIALLNGRPGASAKEKARLAP